MLICNLFLCALLLFLVILIISIIHIDPQLEKYININDIIPLSKARKDLKTGDVLIFMGITIRAAFIRIYLQSPATHVGIIIRTDEKNPDGSPVFPDAISDIYVLDIGGKNLPFIKNIHGARDLKDRDVSLRPLNNVFTTGNSCNIYGIIPISEPIKITMEDIKKYFNYEFNWSPLAFLKYYHDTNFKVCSNFVAKIHEDFNVRVNIEKPPYQMTPEDYFKSPGLYFVDADR